MANGEARMANGEGRVAISSVTGCVHSAVGSRLDLGDSHRDNGGMRNDR